MRTVVVCSHDDDGKEQLEPSHDVVEEFVLDHVYGRDV